MRAVVQRVKQARVEVDGRVAGAIDTGLLVLLGVAREDSDTDGEWLAEKIARLRIFPDEDGKMNRDVAAAGGSLLVISQFTLYGDCRKGRRPSFDGAANPEKAIELYQLFIKGAEKRGLRVSCGVFQAHMQVYLQNDGPVTLILDSKDRLRN
jgi:D-tyrosyl-tRNA(Tyr) deacylase